MSIEFFLNGFWWIFGTILILAEFIIPGLVIMFVGLGALSVAALKYYGLTNGIVSEILVWFASSIVYCLTLRMLVMKIYPSDTRKENSNEDTDAIGTIVEVSSDIARNETGRIKYCGTTWAAKAAFDKEITCGSKAKIIGRENLTWIVEKID